MTIKDFFSFQGRLRRKHYLVACVPVIVISLLLGVLQESTQLNLRIFLFPLSALLIPASVRRIHDMGYAGWLVLPVFFIPYVSVLLLVMPGMSMANAYGPDPRAQANLP